jgi:hypothetical protein
MIFIEFEYDLEVNDWMQEIYRFFFSKSIIILIEIAYLFIDMAIRTVLDNFFLDINTT